MIGTIRPYGSRRRCRARTGRRVEQRPSSSNPTPRGAAGPLVRAGNEVLVPALGELHRPAERPAPPTAPAPLPATGARSDAEAAPDVLGDHVDVSQRRGLELAATAARPRSRSGWTSDPHPVASVPSRPAPPGPPGDDAERWISRSTGAGAARRRSPRPRRPFAGSLGRHGCRARRRAPDPRPRGPCSRQRPAGSVVAHDDPSAASSAR